MHSAAVRFALVPKAQRKRCLSMDIPNIIIGRLDWGSGKGDPYSTGCCIQYPSSIRPIKEAGCLGYALAFFLLSFQNPSPCGVYKHTHQKHAQAMFRWGSGNSARCARSLELFDPILQFDPPISDSWLFLDMRWLSFLSSTPRQLMYGAPARFLFSLPSQHRILRPSPPQQEGKGCKTAPQHQECATSAKLARSQPN